MKRELYIDIAKGLLIYLVILGHILDYATMESTYIFAMHMPAFFIINGFLLGKSYDLSIKEFLINRVKNYLLPYFIFALIGALIHIAWGQFEFINSEMFFTLLVTCQPDWLYTGSGWFLWAAFWGNIGLYFWLKLHNDKQIPSVVKAVIFLMIMYLATHILEFNCIQIPGYGRLPWKIDSAIMAFIFMAIGFYIREYRLLEKNQRFVLLFLETFLFISIARINGWSNVANCSYNNCIYYYIAAIVGTILVLTLAIWIGKIRFVSQVLGLVGSLSLPMFMLHGMFLSYMNTHMNIITGTIPLGRSLLYSVVVVFVVLPFAKLYSFIYKIVFK